MFINKDKSKDKELYRDIQENCLITKSNNVCKTIF